MEQYQPALGIVMEVFVCALIFFAILLMLVYMHDTIMDRRHPESTSLDKYYSMLLDLKKYCQAQINKSNHPNHSIKHTNEYIEALGNVIKSLDKIEKFW